MKTYYKVVKKDLTSCFITGVSQVQYKFNEYVKSPKWLPMGHQVLFVFYNLDSAYSFMCRLSGALNVLDIYECEVQGILECLPYFLNTDALAIGSFCCSTMGSFPIGTVAVKKVKLIKKI